MDAVRRRRAINCPHRPAGPLLRLASSLFLASIKFAHGLDAARRSPLGIGGRCSWLFGAYGRPRSHQVRATRLSKPDNIPIVIILAVAGLPLLALDAPGGA